VHPLAIDVLRGGTIESRHRVHAVTVVEGAVVAAAGDPHLVTFMRSAAKPLQALPLARAREDLSDDEVAIACASHLADDAQLAAVRSLLAAAPASEDELECGPAGSPPRGPTTP
jgi:L-asparaginase II